MFGPWIQMWSWLKARFPHGGLKKRNLNFITLHYIYVLSCVIVGSLLVFLPGRVRYIDALYLASGAATQSGLNPIDLNSMRTFSQLAIYMLSFLGNPITINTSVVFIRLYWFEKRFQNVVKEARSTRRTRSRSRSEATDERDVQREERGVVGRNIVVLHGRHAGLSNRDIDPKARVDNDNQTSTRDIPASTDVTDGNGQHPPKDGANEKVSPLTSANRPVPFRRDITFADEVGDDSNAAATTPSPLLTARSAEHHIAVLENQRNPKDNRTLRIPGPRDFDRGEMPHALTEDEARLESASQPTSATELSQPRPDGLGQAVEDVPVAAAEEPPWKRSITIDEPTSPRSKVERNIMPSLKLRRPGSAARGSFARNVFPALPRTGTMLSRRSSVSKDPMPYLSWTPTVGRNSAFVDLTEEQREELGGIEYRALKTLAAILVVYNLGFYFLSAIPLLIWIIKSNTYGAVVDANQQSRAWWAFFTTASAFSNTGFTLTVDSMVSFQRAVFPLLMLIFLFVIGNTGFPCTLRLILWISSFIVRSQSRVWEEIRFLLDHPRRCFTLLFPSYTTWWLFWILVILNVVDLILFIILDLNNPAVASLPVGIRILDGLFQATSTRTAGLTSVNLAQLHPAIQISYMIMMYISAYPVAISVRSTNVYEEKSLGIYGGPEIDHARAEEDRSYMAAHFRKQLGFDLWYVFLGFFVIAIIEGARIRNTNDVAFTSFSLLFEVASGYGNVGLSLGYPNINASFSAEFKTLSKLVMIAMQIRGRHRGLPNSLDRAILLPSDSLQQKEEQRTRARLGRRGSNLSTMEADGAGSRSNLRSPSPPPPQQRLNGSAPERLRGSTTEKHNSHHMD